MLFGGGLGNLLKQLFVQRRTDRGCGRAELCEIAVEFRTFVSDKRVLFERSVRRNQDNGFGATADHPACQLGHCVNRTAYVDNRIAPDFRHHDRRMRSNSSKDYRTNVSHGFFCGREHSSTGESRSRRTLLLTQEEPSSHGVQRVGCLQTRRSETIMAATWLFLM